MQFEYFDHILIYQIVVKAPFQAQIFFMIQSISSQLYHISFLPNSYLNCESYICNYKDF